ncbi:hypothetical protein ACYOEI_09055 [Singulisphaera rosea]
MMTTNLLLLAVLVTSQAKGGGPKWVEATSKDDTFSFAMPAKPVEKAVVQQSQFGPLNVLEYSCVVDECLYRIEESKLPVEIPDEKLEGALGAGRDSIAKKTKIVSDKAKVVEGWHARELMVEAPLRPGADPSKIAMLILYADQRYYQVRVFSLRPGTSPKHVRKFFDAFKPRKAGPVAKTKSS